MLSEISQRKTNTICSHLCVELKTKTKTKKEPKKLIDTGNRLVVARGSGVEGGWNGWRESKVQTSSYATNAMGL